MGRERERERETERERELVIYLAHKVTYLQELTRSYFTWNGLAVRPATFYDQKVRHNKPGYSLDICQKGKN